MLARFHTRRFLRGFALLGVAIVLIAAFPAYRSGAQGASEIQTLDNAQIQFANGSYQRTSLSPERYDAVTTAPPDLPGAVQLAPVGVLKPWEKIAVEMPGSRSDAGVAVLGDRLYVVAGSSGAGATDTVLVARINQVLGDIVNHNVPANDPRYVDQSWLNYPLPATTLVPGCGVSMSTRTRSAVAALSTGGNAGFIYVVGGLPPDSQNCATGLELTASAVQVGAVAADGALTWSNGPQLPSDAVAFVSGAPPRGVERASATVIRTSSGKAFLYVIGGLSTYATLLGDTLSNVEASVWRAEINTATGALGAWQRDLVAGTSNPENVPLAGGALGIYDHAATRVTTTVTTQAGSSVIDGIVIAGGFTQLNNTGPNAFVYRATVNPADGDLVWDATPSVDGNQVTLGQGGQTGLSAVSYNNKLYMIGGRPSNTSTVDWVLTATYNDNLDIKTLPGSLEYFVGREASVLPNPGQRSDTASAIMDALPPADNPTAGIGTAWALVVGGSDASATPTRTIFRGRIGGEEADGGFRATEGWYYSQPFNVTFVQPGGVTKNARLLSIRWAAEIDRAANANADMVVQFRKTLRADPNCPDDSVFAPTDQWFTLDADTGTPFFSRSISAAQPFNTVTLKDAFGTADFVATCFQYRVRFLQNGLTPEGQPIAAANPGVSPKLFSMNVEKVVAGNADIRIAENGFNYTARNGRLVSLNMAIRNLSLEGRDNTQNAGLEGDDGGFWVHLCVAYAAPGQPAPTLDLPTLPLAEGQKTPCMKAYYQVYKWQMQAGNQLSLIGSGSQTWQDVATNAPIPDVRTLFSEPGTYRVALLLDSWNYVNEGVAGELNNRGEEATNGNQPQILTLEITGAPLNNINLPIIRR